MSELQPHENGEVTPLSIWQIDCTQRIQLTTKGRSWNFDSEPGWSLDFDLKPLCCLNLHLPVLGTKSWCDLSHGDCLSCWKI